MDRRTSLGGLASSLLAAPLAAEAQPAGKVHRVGVLIPGNPSTGMAGFELGLRALGWAPGQNLVIEVRYARGDLERLPALAAELVHLNVDVLLVSSAAIPAVRAATRTIPTVMTFAVDDPVEAGWGRVSRIPAAISRA